MGQEITVGMADLKVARAPDVLTTVLGSCVGLCLYSAKHQVGGLLHIMLPAAGSKVSPAGFKKAKFADTGIVELLRVLQVEGVGPQDVMAMIFGGAKVLPMFATDIGADNVAATKALLSAKGIKVKALKVGGTKGCRIKFYLEMGKVLYQSFGAEAEEF